jgi:hypothetical protein
MRFFIATIAVIVVLGFVSCHASAPSMITLDDMDVSGNHTIDIPNYIPIYHNARNYQPDPLRILDEPLSGTNLREVVVGTLITKANPADVYEWYVEAVTDKGWALIDLLGYDGQIARVQAKRGEEFLDLSIMPDLVTQDIHITYLVTRESR